MPSKPPALKRYSLNCSSRPPKTHAFPRITIIPSSLCQQPSTLVPPKTPSYIMSSAPYIPFRLDGKVALVTGSGRGIGAAIATELGRAGAKVVVNYAHSRESAEKVVAAIKALGSDAVAFQADVRQVAQTTKLMDQAVAHFGKLDIVCSNSGVVSFGHLSEITEVGSSLSCPCSVMIFSWQQTSLIRVDIHRRNSTASSASTRAASSSSPARPTAT